MENTQQPREFMSTVSESTVEGHIINVARGGEAIVFEVNLGLVTLVAIANIPAEGEEKAPVYVKIKVPEIAFRRAQKDHKPARQRPQRDAAPGTAA